MYTFYSVSSVYNVFNILTVYIVNSFLEGYIVSFVFTVYKTLTVYKLSPHITDNVQQGYFVHIEFILHKEDIILYSL